MAQNRRAPAYQEYAAEVLSRRSFKLAGLAERGLLYTLRNECWVNGSVPAETSKLARYLGFSEDQIKAALTDEVMTEFVQKGDSLICPELDDYKQHLEDRKLRQSEGGKKGAKKTNSKSKSIDSDSSSTPPSNSQVPRQATNESLVQYSKVKHSTDKLSTVKPLDKGNPLVDEFLSEYESADNDINGFPLS